MDYAQRWLVALHDVLPKPLYDVLHAIYLKSVSLPEWYSGLTGLSAADVFAALHLQSILPPLISVFTIYFMLLSLYRTTSFFVRSTVFLVKWGVMIGAVGAALGYIASIVAPDSFSAFNRSNTVTRSKRRKPHSTRPRAWEPFGQHQRWREEQSEEAMDAGRVAREMVEKLLDATAGPNGWWGTLTGMAAKTVVGEEYTGSRKRSSKGAKGKAKSR